MSNPGTPSKSADAALSQAGRQADAILKPKISVRIWVVLVIAVVANAVGVLFHF